jgi:soluble cytochrome b562
VELRAVTLAPARAVSLRFGAVDAAEGQSEQVLVVKDGREVAGEFVITGETLWRFGVEDLEGQAQVEGVRRRIRLEADKVPEVVLKLPAEDLVLEDLRRVAVAFEARDDHGLTEVSVVVALAEDPEHPEKVPQPGVMGLRFAAEDEVDLSLVQAEPGDRLALFVEAWDNNGVDGKQRGVSATRYITVNSPQQKHFDLSERLRALVDQLVDALADRLEAEFYAAVPPAAPLPTRIAALMKRTDGVVTALAGVVTDMTEDPLTPEEVRLALTGRLGGLETAVAEEKTVVEPATVALERGDRTAVDQANKANAAVVDQLEQTIVLVEAMVARLALEDMAAMAEEIQAARERLKELVAQYKKNPDDAALKARIMRDVKRLRDRINEMRARMAALQQKLPEEFLNLDGLEKGEVSKGLDETKDALNELEKLLDEGKIDEALAALEEMEKSLDELSGSLNKDMQDLHQQTNPEMQKALSELMDQTRDLMRQQKTLGEETEAAAKAEQEAQRKLLEEALGEKLAELDAKAAELAEKTAGLDPRDMPRMAEEELSHLNERVNSLRAALERKALMEALEMASRGNEHLDSLERFTQYDGRAGENRKKVKQSQQLGQEIEKGLADLINEARKKSGQGGEGEQLRDMAKRQQKLSEATRKLKERMEQKAGDVPGLGDGPMKKAQGAAEAMQQAGESLGQQRPGQARPGQQQAESELQGLMEGLKQANKPQRAERQQQSGREMSREKVEIPDAEAHQSPDAFRKDLLDAMKDKAPDQYREQVKRYYESLVH